MENNLPGTSLGTVSGAANCLEQILHVEQPLLQATGQHVTSEPNRMVNGNNVDQPVISASRQIIGNATFTGQNDLSRMINGNDVDLSVNATSRVIYGNVTISAKNNKGEKIDSKQIGNMGRDTNAVVKIDTKSKGKQSFASLFKDNRAPSENSKLHFVAPSPMGELEFTDEDIDSVEKSFGFCLVGCVMGPRPSPYVVKNFIKGLGENVKFTFKDNGWIRFQFPNEMCRDAILNGGPYMIFGKQLFLKKLPSCFLFSKEDMEFIPTWVQIFGLPADCWTTSALSKIASVVEKPIHTDVLTITKRGSNYARILVEIDAKKPKPMEYVVKFPSGKKTTISFVYEFETKFCDKCKSVGHTVEGCGGENTRGRHRSRPTRPDGKKPQNDSDIPAIHRFDAGPSMTKPGMDVVPDSGQMAETHHLAGDVDRNKNNGKDVEENSNEPEFMEYADVDSDDLLDILSTVVTKDKDEWKEVKGKKNNNKKQKKSYRKEPVGKSGYNVELRKFFDGMVDGNSCDKGEGSKGLANSKGIHVKASRIKSMDEVRPPNTSSRLP